MGQYVLLSPMHYMRVWEGVNCREGEAFLLYLFRDTIQSVAYNLL